MRRLLIHIGTPKAGSTSLQHWLAANRAALAGRGVDYPSLGGRDPNHRALALALEGRADPARRAALVDRLDAALAGDTAEAVVLSAEQFEGAANAAEIAGFLAGRAARHGRRAQAVVFLRPQADYLNAVYAQHVRRMFTAERFGPFLERMIGAPRFDYGRFLAPWSDRDDMDFVALPLVPAAGDGGIGRRLLAVAGLADRADGFAPPDRLNATPGPLTIEVWRRLAACDGRERIGERYAEARRAVETAAAARGWDRERFSGLDAGRVAMIEARFAAGDEAFARRHWATGWDAAFAPRRGEPRSNEVPAGAGGPDLDAVRAVVDDVLARFARPERPWRRIGRLLRGREG